jgi:predicted house-cleaning NTP pyrophosphatase (Maf/HAM1 superfamily)
VCPSLYEENLDPSKYKCHSEYVLDCATSKVQEVALRLTAEGNKPDIIIGADTVVSMDGKVYGKPKEEEKAVEMLKE